MEFPPKGRVYDKKPFRMELKQDKKYFWCSCGHSKNQVRLRMNLQAERPARGVDILFLPVFLSRFVLVILKEECFTYPNHKFATESWADSFYGIGSHFGFSRNI